MLDKFLYQVSKFPKRIAVKSDNLSLSYAELLNEASAVASGLKNQGLNEKCVGISLKSKTQELITCIGVLLSNNHFFFIPEEIKDDWWEQVPVNLLITDRDQAKNPVVLSFDFNEIKNSPVLGLNITWETEVLPNKLFCIYCTSGSTGSSKYVVHDYQSIMEDTYRQVDENKIQDSDTIDFIFSASFSSSLASIFPALISGASIAIHDLTPENLKDIPLFWQKHQVTFATLTSSVFRTLPRISSLNLRVYTKSIRFLCLGGEPILESDLQLFSNLFPRNAQIQLAYASTETRTLSQIKIYQNTQLKLIHDGFPVRNKTIKILDKHGKDCPANKEGELVVHSPYISLGYYIKRSLKKHDQVGKDRIYRTGDRGFFTEEGSLRLTGRVHSLQKVNGKWIDLNNLEKRICQVIHSGDCKILVNKDENGFDYLIACLEVDEINSENSNFNKINSQIKLDVLPRFYTQFKGFPLNANGKIDKNKLLEISKWREFSTISDQINDPITKQIHQIWCDNLGVNILNLDADFFSDLGGSSLLSVLIVSELSQKFNKDIESQALFKYRTIRKISQFLKNVNEKQHFPCIHWISSELNSDLPYFFFLETGHNNSFKTILKGPISSNLFNLAYLRIDPFKVLEGLHPEKIIEEIVTLLNPFPKPILLAISFHGFVAAKINQVLGGALILIDSPWYIKGANGKVPIQNHLSTISLKFRTLPFHRAVFQVGTKFLVYFLKKIKLKNNPSSPFQRTVLLFISQAEPIEKISHALYFFSTGSADTSKKDIESWRKITELSFSVEDISGGHLDALFEAHSDMVIQKINKFLLRIGFIS